MIYDLMLRWVVTGLFVLSAAECGLPIITKRRPWTLVVSRGHFVMAVAMAVMACVFLLAALGFVTMAIVAAHTTALRALYGYHGLMMLATAWMYAIMNGHLRPAGSSIQTIRLKGLLR